MPIPASYTKKISLCAINVLIWLVSLHMVSYSGVLWKNCVHTGALDLNSIINGCGHAVFNLVYIVLLR